MFSLGSGKLKIWIDHHCHRDFVRMISAVAALGPLDTFLLALYNALPVLKIQIGLL